MFSCEISNMLAGKNEAYKPLYLLFSRLLYGDFEGLGIRASLSIFVDTL